MLTIDGSNPIIPGAYAFYDNYGMIPIFHSCFFSNDSSGINVIPGSNYPDYYIVSPGFKLELYTILFTTENATVSQTIDNLNGTHAKYVADTGDFISCKLYWNKNGDGNGVIIYGYNGSDGVLTGTPSQSQIESSNQNGATLNFVSNGRIYNDMSDISTNDPTTLFNSRGQNTIVGAYIQRQFNGGLVGTFPVISSIRSLGSGDVNYNNIGVYIIVAPGFKVEIFGNAGYNIGGTTKYVTIDNRNQKTAYYNKLVTVAISASGNSNTSFGGSDVSSITLIDKNGRLIINENSTETTVEANT